MRRPAFLLLVAVLVAAVLSSCTRSADEQSGAGLVAESKPFPRLSGPAVGGGTFDTTKLAGKPFVLNVWATWCGPCAREQPALRLLQQHYGDRVGFLGIDYRDDSSAAKAWLEQFGVGYPSLSDPSGRYAKDLGFPFLPDTYVVDATGTIRFAIFGETNGIQLGGLVDKLLAEQASATP
jgi:cytochrome c biogenesis protein CcmG/thiol:disulfide interchange protein DsbE